MRYAHIESGLVQEILCPVPGFCLEDCFSAEVVAACVPCGEDVGIGWQFDGTDFCPAPQLQLSLEEFKSHQQKRLTEQYERALAGALALADPSPASVALEAALWAVEDQEGLEFIRTKLQAEYSALAAQIEACKSAEELAAVRITFGV